MTHLARALLYVTLVTTPAAACPSCAGQPQTLDTFVLVLGLMAVPVVVFAALVVLIRPHVRAVSKGDSAWIGNQISLRPTSPGAPTSSSGK